MTLPTGNRASRIRSNVSRRQELKKKWDRHCKYEAGDELPRNLAVDGQAFALENYSESSENWQRLLDEGVVVDGDGWAFAVICKGAIKQFYNNLPKNFVGYINKDHISAIGLGKFTKNDLRLVKLSGGRYALDVNVKLDDDLYAVKDLKHEMNRKALSVEMFVDADEYATAESVTGDKEQGKWLIPLISELKIEGYAVCDNPKNANSYDEGLLEKASNSNLTEETTMNKFMNGEQVDPDTEAPDEAITQENTDTEETEATEVKASGVDPTEAAPEGATEDEANEDAETPEETSEETTDDATEEATENAEDDSETAGTEDGDADDEGDRLSAVEETIKTLKAEVEQLRAEKADLETKLSAKTAEKKDFESRLSDILAFASDSEPTGDEGGETTPENSKSGGIEDIYSNAFKELE